MRPEAQIPARRLDITATGGPRPGRSGHGHGQGHGQGHGRYSG